MALNVPGAVQSTQTYALFNPLDLYQDEIYQKLVRRVPYMSSLSWMRSLKGRLKKRRTRRHEYSFYEEGQFMKAAATIESVTPNGAKFDIVLSAADHSDIGGTGETSFPVKNMLCLFQDGKTHGFVETVDRDDAGAHMVTVKKLNTAQDIATAAVAGTTILFYSNAQPEKSGKTESRVPQFEKITNKMQEIREGFEATDFELQNASWFQTESGKYYLWYKGISDTMQRFEMQRELASLLVPQSDGLTDAAGSGVQTMFGLDPQIVQHGRELEYLGKPDGAAFDEVMLELDNNYGDKEYMCGGGHNVMLALKDFLVEFAKGGTGNISFSPFDGGEQQAIRLNFKYYSVFAYTFYFQQWDLLSHKDSLGAAGLPFRHNMYFLPAGMTRNADPEPREGDAEYEPYIQLVTPTWGKALNSNVDKGDYLMWDTGALSPGGPTDDILNDYVHIVAYQSLEMRCRNKFLKWTKA